MAWRIPWGGHDADSSIEQFDAIFGLKDAGFPQLVVFLDGEPIGSRRELGQDRGAAHGARLPSLRVSGNVNAPLRTITEGVAGSDRSLFPRQGR
jgi:hypothetical protein